jgi:K+-sensing histidine kinase KdpD
MPSGRTEPATDPNWPKLLRLAVHEFRSPLTVVAGYVRMLLKERVGPISEQQRRLLEEADKSCARLSQLLIEAGDLAHLEAGDAPFNRSAVDLRAMLTEIVAALPDLPDRTVTVELDAAEAGTVHGDATRLRDAFSAILSALRRELVTSDRLGVRAESDAKEDTPIVRIIVGEAARMPQLVTLAPQEVGPFDELRGGNGLSLANARRVIDAHGGSLRAPLADGRACAIVSIPSV